MRALIIDEKVKARIAEVMRHAEANIQSMDDLLDIHNKVKVPPGDVSNFVCNIPVGYRIVYTLEKRPDLNDKVYRHISISVDRTGMLPSVVAAETIIKEFGFGELDSCSMFKLEKIGDDHEAINIFKEFI